MPKRIVTCCVSVQGLHSSGDSAFEVFEGESSGETLFTASAIVKWDGLAFGAFPGCVTRCITLMSRFLLPRSTKVTPHNVAIFSLSFFVFGHTKNLGIGEATKDSSGESSKKRENKEHLWAVCGGFVLLPAVIQFFLK